MDDEHGVSPITRVPAHAPQARYPTIQYPSNVVDELGIGRRIRVASVPVGLTIIARGRAVEGRYINRSPGDDGFAATLIEMVETFLRLSGRGGSSRTGSPTAPETMVYSGTEAVGLGSNERGDEWPYSLSAEKPAQIQDRRRVGLRWRSSATFSRVGKLSHGW
jgi:hypothetical protein